MKVEDWARVICQRELDQPVERHDDGSSPGMYDLRIGEVVGPAVAIECVRAVDATLEELWNVGPIRGPLMLGLSGDWICTLTREARVKKRLLTSLESPLRDCEERGLWDIHVDWALRKEHPHLFTAFQNLGITWASCVHRSGAGNVHLTLDSRGGVVDEEGRAVPSWIGDFLRSEAQSDVLLKLARSRARECHAFVPVGWSGAPWPVESYLTSGLHRIPVCAPELPQPVTSVWVVSMQATHGIRWTGQQWVQFDASIKP